MLTAHRKRSNNHSGGKLIMTSISQRCHAIASSRRFQKVILLIILANAILMGIETSEAPMERHGPLLLALNTVTQAIFVLEIAMRLAAHGRWHSSATAGTPSILRSWPFHSSPYREH